MASLDRGAKAPLLLLLLLLMLLLLWMLSMLMLLLLLLLLSLVHIAKETMAAHALRCCSTSLLGRACLSAARLAARSLAFP
jgi:hypothetical protein